ncbi:MAG: hypothetical protein SAL07_25215 [Oscillatoria sp. PMC 1051.18]|nr:hypothetical protein [Oscillatoria sp. PMC 1050.18]MEC5033207.1 hypothetical protein [Oscillatoria sp. PMC 1051.18]
MDEEYPENNGDNFYSPIPEDEEEFDLDLGADEINFDELGNENFDDHDLFDDLCNCNWEE